MTCKIFFTRGIKKKKKNHVTATSQILLTQMAQRAIMKNLNFTRTESKKIKLQRAKSKVFYTTWGKTLLTI